MCAPSPLLVGERESCVCETELCSPPCSARPAGRRSRTRRPAELWAVDQQLTALHQRRDVLLTALRHRHRHPHACFPAEPAGILAGPAPFPAGPVPSAASRGWPAQRVLLAVGALLVEACSPLATLALVAGIALRWQPPFLTGALAASVVAVAQLAPYGAGVPRWSSFGAVGAVLLVRGRRYERRRRNARRAAHWVTTLR